MDREPVAKLFERKITAPKIDVSYPEIKNLKESLFVQVRINEIIRSVVYNLIHDRIKSKSIQPEIRGRYRIACNKNGILSIVFAIEEMDEYNVCYSSQKSITLDLGNARVYDIEDLFSCKKGLIEKLSALALEKIKSENMPLRNYFNGIDKEQEYYFNGKDLVIYYQPSRYAAAKSQVLEISLTLTQLQNFIGQDCPLARFTDTTTIGTSIKDEKQFSSGQDDEKLESNKKFNGEEVSLQSEKYDNIYTFPETGVEDNTQNGL